MASVALAATSFGALISASPAWAAAVLTVVSAAVLAAILMAVYGPAAQRAFASGYLVGLFFYLLLWQANANGWFGLSSNDLLTNRIVNQFYRLVAGELPEQNMAPGGVSFWTGKSFSMGPASVPDYYQFHKIAHWLIACYFGLACALIASRLRLRSGE